MTPAPNTPEWQAMLEQVRQHQNAARAKDQAYKAQLKAQNQLFPQPQARPAINPQFLESIKANLRTDLPDEETPTSAVQQKLTIFPSIERRDLRPDLTMNVDKFSQAWSMARGRALEQYSQYHKELGCLFDLAVLLRTVTLMWNTKAKSNAILCGVLPFNVAAYLCGWSREHTYRLIRTKPEGEFFKRLIGCEAWVSDYWIASSGAADSEAARATGGTIYTTHPTPLPLGKSPRPRGADFKRVWRDMGKDIEAGRTASLLLEQAKTRKVNATDTADFASHGDKSHTKRNKSNMSNILLIKQFFYLSLPVFSIEKIVVNVCDLESLNAVNDALEEPIPTRYRGRVAWVDRIANAISQALNDHHSVEGWLAVAWTAAKAIVYHGIDAQKLIMEALVGTLVQQSSSGKVRNMGAYARKLLNGLDWQKLEKITEDLHLGKPSMA